jgi:hypothetical protein
LLLSVAALAILRRAHDRPTALIELKGRSKAHKYHYDQVRRVGISRGKRQIHKKSESDKGALSIGTGEGGLETSVVCGEMSGKV